MKCGVLEEVGSTISTHNIFYVVRGVFGIVLTNVHPSVDCGGDFVLFPSEK